MDEVDTRTIYDLVRNAIWTQDASNLSGVVHSFSQDITRLRTLLEERLGVDKITTTMINRHPICVLYSDKISQLSGSTVGLRFSRAYNWCKEMQDQRSLATTNNYPEVPLPGDTANEDN